MVQNLGRHGHEVRTLSLLVLCRVAGATEPSDVNARFDGDVAAKGVAVLRATFPTLETVSRVEVAISRDGTEYRAVGVDGFGRQRFLPWLVASEARGSTICVATLLRTMREDGLWAFDDPGTYHLRWRIAFGDQGADGLKTDQTVELQPARPADVAFLAGLSNVELTRRLLTDGSFDEWPEAAREVLLAPSAADHRAMMVIEELLRATRAKNPWEALESRKSVESALIWGDALYALAREFPESSYAPYAAHYAACCYAGVALSEAVETVRVRRVPEQPPDEIHEAKQRFALLQADARAERAFEAFAFAAERADAYLRPKALYQEAYLAGAAGFFERFDTLLAAVEEAAPGNNDLANEVARLRKESAQFRQQAAEANTGPSNDQH